VVREEPFTNDATSPTVTRVWTAAHRTAIGLMLVAAACALLAPAAGRAAAPVFDHFTTGFELLGLHRDVSCEACHVGGIFKGTPHDCFACHAPSSRVAAIAKPTSHIISNNDCAQCHTPFGFKPVAMFNHLNVFGTCTSCHNGVQSTGKPAAHIPTAAECSTCHLVTLPWTAAHFTHAGITGNCASCHDNVHAPGQPPTHLPSKAPCETCHSPTNFTTFAGTQMNHAGITNNCQACHETGMSWYGVTMVDRPTPAMDPLHPTAAAPNGADCSNCHRGFNVGDFAKNTKPSNHIPTSPSAQCSSCHKTTEWSVLPALADIHSYAPSTTSNCAQCHGSAAPTFAIPAANFSIVGLPGNHVPTTSSCEACHVGAGSSVAATPVPNGAKFSGSLMSHAGLTTCISCHGPTVTTFAGITKIVVMPATTPTGAGSHVPSGTACEGCHLGSMPAGLVPANATTTAPGTKFATPVPTTAMIHSGITSACSSCHEGNDLWMDMSSYPISPTALTGNSSTQYLGFSTRPGATAGTFSVADAAHPSTGDCSKCHSNTNYFDGNLKPSNHIPTAATAQCSNCHKSADFSALPALVDIHTYAPSTSTSCGQCHGSAAPTFAIPAANFSIVGLPGNHVPTTASCEACHVGAGSSVAATPVPNGAKFANSAMSHAGITACVSCHGPTVTTFAGITRIVVMPATSPMGPASHIPSGTACEGCHLGSMPPGLVPANATTTAPGTKFATPAPTTAQIHTGITSNCSSCHERNDLWMDVSSYPITPAALTGSSSTQYLGFNTRPGATAGTFSIADAAHPATGDCSQCHSNTNYFAGGLKPANHIPTAATAQCGDCHKSADFSVLPALVDIHTYAPSTTGNCAQCHGSAAPTFAIPAANFSIVGLPGNHVPTTASCEACHVGAGSSVAVTPVPNGAKFSGSLMSHAGLTTCISCHGPTVTTFAGITRIVVMPATSPTGPASHIPSGTACEGCHLGSMPSGPVPANASTTAPGTKFATPAPTTAQIHSGITSSCASCHESSYVWMDMSSYPISPATLSGNTSTQYFGFNTRPGAAASTFSVADAAHPASGDCANCHGGNTNYFSGQAEPANHIPTTSQTCGTCHTTPGNFAVYTTDLTALHSAVSTSCSTCHADGKGPFAGAPGFTIVQLSTRGLHIPITSGGAPVECSGCHKSVTTFTGTIMSHGAIGDSGTSAGGDACDACHEGGFENLFYGITIRFTRDQADQPHHICGAPGTPTAPNVTVCSSGGGSDCLTGCHQHQNIPSQYKRMRPAGRAPSTAGTSAMSAAKAGALATAPTMPARRSGIGILEGAEPGDASIGAPFDHLATSASCVSCHDSTRAAGKSANHPLSGTDCDRCHTTSAWKPAAFDHAGLVAGTCASCHNGLQTAGKPPAHLVTVSSCDSCHYVLAWKPTKPIKPTKPAGAPAPSIQKRAPRPAASPLPQGAPSLASPL